MKKLNVSVRFVLFVVFAAVTLAAPLSIVWKYESALHYGTLFKFRTQPVDPVDVFRGRYVTLSFADNSVREPDKGAQYDDHNNGILYVRLKRDAEGFAVPAEAGRKRLSGDDVVTVDDAYRSDDGWRLYYPFNRYYLPEDVAPMAEQLYREANRNRHGSDGESRAKADTYVAVRVRNGVGVIEELYLNGVPVREAVRAEMQRRQKQQRVNDTQ